MPFVKISALPGNDFDCAEVMEAMEDEFAKKKTGLPIGTATFIWQTLDCITHRQKGETDPRSLKKFDPSEKEIPIFVDLYITSVFNYENIANMMDSITTILNEKTRIPREYVFIHTHIGNPGRVYINDEVWPCLLDHPGSETSPGENPE